MSAPTYTQQWEAFAEGARFPERVREALVTEFHAGRNHQIDLLARRCVDLSSVSADVRKEVLRHRAECGYPTPVERREAEVVL